MAPPTGEAAVLAAVPASVAVPSEPATTPVPTAPPGSTSVPTGETVAVPTATTETASPPPALPGPEPALAGSETGTPAEASPPTVAAPAAAGAGEAAEAQASPAPLPGKPIALPASAEPVGDAEAPTAPVAEAVEAPLPATPKARPAETPAPVPTTPTGPKADATPGEAGTRGSSDDEAPADPERAPQAAAPRPPVLASQGSAPVPAAPIDTAPAQPATQVASLPQSSPSAPAPAPAPALEATLRMAAQAGFTRARVTLRPAELGGVEVFLREGSAGLAATVVADTPHAAQLLQSSATELQRRLAAQGLELSSLQISVGGESAGAAHGGRDGRTAAQASGTAPRDIAGEPETAAEKTRTIDLGGGVLVDVLA